MPNFYKQALDDLTAQHQLRQIPKIKHHGMFVEVNGKKLLNIASNDYLGIGTNTGLQNEFLDFVAQMPTEQRPKFGSTSSRLLTGNDVQLELLEAELVAWYNSAINLNNVNCSSTKSALVCNSGYHANIGLLAALTSLPTKTLILADKLVHASIIDGMQLAKANNKTDFKRYKHNDYNHLRQLINNIDKSVERVIIVTESIFSMDGDRADLTGLVAIKKELTTSNLTIELYVDEAHAVGAYGATGLGIAEETNTLTQIDYLIGTFGKTFASMGAYIICRNEVKQWLVNNMRSLIYSTALPPITHAWNRFVLAKIVNMQTERKQLKQVSNYLKQAVQQKTGLACLSESAIVPYVLGANALAIAKAKQLQEAGFYALAIRPPTVPKDAARIRLVMNANIDIQTCDKLIEVL